MVVELFIIQGKLAAPDGCNSVALIDNHDLLLEKQSYVPPVSSLY